MQKRMRLREDINPKVLKRIKQLHKILYIRDGIDLPFIDLSPKLKIKSPKL